MKFKKILLIVIVFIAFDLMAQDNKNMISGNILGASSAIGLTYERIVGNKASVELGVGLIGLGAGLSIYPWDIIESRLCFYTGLKVSSIVLVDVGGGTVAYIPFGATYFMSDWILGFDIGPANGKLVSSSFGGSTSETTRFYGYGNLKIGFRF
ncbi:MAG: hypothetical protein QNL43_01995 [Crocinitomicaceae bacterium]|jgi:hypothetical protein|tara:strand:+ start:123 stop:581 length:459 start_codon:yes stop_codon:yes gene_type:complete